MRNFIIQHMEDGVMVMDTQGCLLDINPAMCDILDIAPRIGDSLQNVLNEKFALFERFFAVKEAHEEIAIPNHHRIRYFDMRMLSFDDGTSPASRLILLHEITERREAEERLRQGEALIRAIVDTTADGIISIDSNGIIFSFNTAATSIFGYRPEEVIGKNISILMPEPNASLHDSYIRRRISTGETRIIGVHREEFGKRKDGSMFPIYLAVNEINIDGRLMYTGLIRDVTENKRIENERNELFEQMQATLSETRTHAHRLSLLNEMSQQISPASTEQQIFDVATHYILQLFSAEQIGIFLKTPSPDYFEVKVHQGSPALLNPGDKIPLEGTITGQVVKHRKPVNIPDLNLANTVFKSYLENGSFHSALFVPVMVRGEIIGVVALFSQLLAAYTERDEDLLLHVAAFVGIAIDNVRRTQERDLLFTQTQENLAETREHAYRLNLLNEMSQHINLSTSEQEIYQVATRYITRLFPADQLSIIFQTADPETLEVAVYHGVSQFMKPGQQFARQRTLVGEVIQHQQPLNIPDIQKAATSYKQAALQAGLQSFLIVPVKVQENAIGTISLASRTFHAYSDRDQDLLLHIASFVGIAIDNIRRTKELEQAIQSADAASRAKSEFLATMSHELRTPLNGILGYVQILGKDKDLTLRQREGLEVINRSGEHLLTLINDILDLSKIEAGRMELGISEFNLPQMLENICDMLKLRADQKGIEFRYEVLSELPTGVYGDEIRLRQVLLNILGNAVKFTEQGGVVFKVGHSEDRIRFQIEDTGIGMSLDAMESIFQPFRQFDKRRTSAEGTGLGLAISSRLVKMMGGELQVRSEPGEGSAFWFELTLPEVENYVASPAEPEKDIKGYRGSARKILVVDDRWENRSVLTGMLLPLGFLVQEAVDGQDCLEKCEKFQPDAILLDLRMPVMDGLEATRQLRQRGYNTVIIAISASAFDHNREESRLAGANDFLAKPFRLQKLLDLLRKQLHIEWVYEDDETIAARQQPHEIIPPPEKDLTTLLDLARQGDVRGISTQAEKLAKQGYGAFAGELQTLAKGFRIKELRQFIIKHRNGND